MANIFKGDLLSSFPALSFYSETPLEKICMIQNILIYLLVGLYAAPQFILSYGEITLLLSWFIQ